jgi:hypothetical protein
LSNNDSEAVGTDPLPYLKILSGRGRQIFQSREGKGRDGESAKWRFDPYPGWRAKGRKGKMHADRCQHLTFGTIDPPPDLKRI